MSFAFFGLVVAPAVVHPAVTLAIPPARLPRGSAVQPISALQFAPPKVQTGIADRPVGSDLVCLDEVRR